MIYRAEDAIPGVESFSVDGPASPRTRRAISPEASAGSAPRIADIAFDADYEYFLQNDASVDSTVEDIETVLAAVNVIYQRDADLRHRLVRLVVRATSADPYVSSAADTMLRELRTHWKSFQTGVDRDVVHLMTGKDLNGGTIGIAYIGVICDESRAYGVSQSRWSASAPFSRRTALTAHELGHNWNAVHCNVEPNVSSPCHIMCSSLGGCDGVGLPNFEPQGQDAIRDFAAGRNCLDQATLAAEGPLPAAGIRLAAPEPSPFERQTRLRYHLDRAGAVGLEIYDVAGQRVAVLVEALQGPGWHTVSWDGRDASGREVAAGVLFARLESGSERRVQRLIRVR